VSSLNEGASKRKRGRKKADIMKKRVLLGRMIVDQNNHYRERSIPHGKEYHKISKFKRNEQMVWRQLQDTFSSVMKNILEDMDQQIAEERDKKRYRLIDKRKYHITSLFGEIELNRNYYRDRETGEYVFLLDRYLEFEGCRFF
jgi:hypothetical protein